MDKLRSFTNAFLAILVLISVGASVRPVLANEELSVIQAQKELAAQEEGYRLGSGDKVKIVVYGEEELSGIYSVSGDGLISFPLIGEIKAAGLDLPALQSLIKSRLKDGFLVAPDVAMEIESHRPFYILGEVKQPGSYDYVANMNILEAVAMAGGFTYRADREKADVLRKQDREQGRNEKDMQAVKMESPARPGDIIVVRERFF